MTRAIQANTLRILLTFFMGLSFVSLAQAQEAINGYVLRDSQGSFRFYWIDHKATFQLRPSNPEVGEQLRRLENLDALRGTALISGKSLILQSLDFVGLRRLMGDWKGPSYLIQFHSFQELSLYTLNSSSALSRNRYKYALSPGGVNNQWKIFLTDENQVSLGTLTLLDEKQILITFYDSRSGEITRTVVLAKTGKK